MVGSCNTVRRRTRAASLSHTLLSSVSLSCALLSLLLLAGVLAGCDAKKDQVTLVELHHISADEALALITPMIPQDMVVTQDRNRLLLYAPADKLNNVLATLEQIDRPARSYLVEIRHSQPKGIIRYTTQSKTDFPLNSFRLTEHKAATLRVDKTFLYPFFDAPVTLADNTLEVSVKYLSEMNSEVSLSAMTTVSDRQQHFQSSWIVPHGHWQVISPKPNQNTTKQFSTDKKNPLDLELRVSPISNGFSTN